ncbi:hypothetical protein ES319_1Z001900v1 [Gossypium barbadense]|uniref:Uncharacterized protein n=1 Tax=Gossypium barbadense TaxID=3634 RepID=A0A5J5NA99_GOSBA|nr:hypothetical protein ES319_1Z001900v1 [Gossypium barbadense]
MADIHLHSGPEDAHAYVQANGMDGIQIEMLLNLLAINNFLVLLRGKTKKPDKDSAIFISFIGNMDKRMKLDSKIKPEHGCHYYSALSMMASKASYENRAYIETIVKDHWKMEYMGFYDHWNDYQEKPRRNSSLCVIKVKTMTP